MATLPSTNPTLLDWMKVRNPDNSIARIVRLLETRTNLLKDMTFRPCNNGTVHRVTSETGLPSWERRRLNRGTTPSKGSHRQFDEPCGMIDGRSQLDIRLARLGGDPMANRQIFDDQFIVSGRHEVSDAIFYDNSKTDQDQINGFFPRYNALTGANNSRNVIDGGGSGADNTSILFVTWNPNKVYGIFPDGMDAGFRKMDMGMELVNDGQATPQQFYAWVTQFEWDFGLAIEDWRYCARICNIDISDLAADAASPSADLVDLMIDAYHALEDPDDGRTVIYCNRTVGKFLHKQAMGGTTSGSGGNVRLALAEWHGKQVTSFLGKPVVIDDRIVSDEAAVT